MKKYSFILITLVFVLSNCSKPTDVTLSPAPTPVPAPTPTPSTFIVDSKWECQVDGVNYSGTVDTSFFKILYPQSSHPDTIVYCNGTSNDKKANIHFKITINRASNLSSAGTFTTKYGDCFLLFDTCSMKALVSPSNSSIQVIYKVDTLKENKLKCTFSGQIELPYDGITNTNGSVHTITNGKFSCEFGKGSAEPKFFSFFNDTQNISGYLISSQIVTNTLIMQGIVYGTSSSNTFKLLVKTGGTIKPGVYKSTKGEVGLLIYAPSNYPYYVTDTLGDVTLTIRSVNNNVVTGTFSGLNKNDPNYKYVTNGTFSCRVKNYIAQTDLAYNWSFGVDDMLYLYQILGGNTTSAKRIQIGSNYGLVINGESDNGASIFKMQLKSPYPITKGVYAAGDFAVNKLDSLYLNVPITEFNFSIKDFLSNIASNSAYCKIDSIDNNMVYGSIYGYIRYHYRNIADQESGIKKGTFSAKF